MAIQLNLRRYVTSFVDESLAIRGSPLKWLYSTNRDQKIVTNSNLPMTIVLSNSMIVPYQKGIVCITFALNNIKKTGSISLKFQIECLDLLND